MALAALVKMPVDSTTTSTPRSPQGRAAGPSSTESALILAPPMTMVSSPSRLTSRQSSEDGIEFEQMSQGGVVRQVVDGHDFQILGVTQGLLGRQGTVEVASDSAEAVHAYPIVTCISLVAASSTSA